MTASNSVPVVTHSDASSALGIRIRSALFEIAAREPEVAPRFVLWIFCSLTAALLVWASFAEVDIVAVAAGRLVPQTYVKIVQPATAGIVHEILVDEGDEVRQGQVLVRLDSTENAADSTAIGRELALQALQLRRVDAELTASELSREEGEDAQLFVQAEAQRRAHHQAYLDSLAQEQAVRDRTKKELTAAREVQRKLEQVLPSYQRSAEAYEKLARDKLVGQLQAEEVRRAAIENAQDLEAQRATVASLEAAVAASDNKLAQLTSTYESDLQAVRVETVSRLSQLRQEQEKLKFRERNLELRAPQAGLVKELATTTVGAVVQPGTVLVSLVPADEPLLAEVMIDNPDIGFIRPGQAVRLKLAAYPFQQYAMLDGRIKTVIADSQTKDQGAAKDGSTAAASSALAFKATVELLNQELKTSQEKFPLAAGMQLNAEIVEGKRTVLEYLLSPVLRIANESGKER